MTGFQDAIDTLYATLEDRVAFSQSLKVLQTSVGVDVTAFHVLIVDPISLLPVGGMSPEAPEGHDVYANQFAAIDPRLSSFKNDSFSAFNLNAVFDKPEHRLSPVYNEFLSDFDGQIGTAVVKRINPSATLVFAGLRSGKFDYFNRSELTRTEYIARNIARIMSFKGLYSIGIEDAEQRTAIYLNGAKGVIGMTQRAEQECKVLDAPLRVSSGRLWVTEKKSNEGLQNAIDAAISGHAKISHDVIIRNRFGEAVYVATVQRSLGDPVRDAFMCAPRVIVHFRNLDSKLTVSETLIRDLFGLSPTEAEITSLLCQGLSAQAIAAQRGVAISTVRWTIRNLLEKFEVSSQTELVALVSRVPGILR